MADAGGESSRCAAKTTQRGEEGGASRPRKVRVPSAPFVVSTLVRAALLDQ